MGCIESNEKSYSNYLQEKNSNVDLVNETPNVVAKRRSSLEIIVAEFVPSAKASTEEISEFFTNGNKRTYTIKELTLEPGILSLKLLVDINFIVPETLPVLEVSALEDAEIYLNDQNEFVFLHNDYPIKKYLEEI